MDTELFTFSLYSSYIVFCVYSTKKHQKQVQFFFDFYLEIVWINFTALWLHYTWPKKG